MDKPLISDAYYDYPIKRKVLILAHSGVGKTFYAQKRDDVLDLDAFVYQDTQGEWKHFSFVSDYIRSSYSVFAVAHDAEEGIKEAFDIVIDTKDISFKVSIEQILSTYVRDYLRGFKPHHLVLNLDGITFSDMAKQIRERYQYSVSTKFDFNFILATFLTYRYDEKQNEKYNFSIEIIRIDNASRANDSVYYDGDDIYTVTYEDVDYSVKIKPQIRKVDSSHKFLMENVICCNPSSFKEFKLDIQSDEEINAIYRLISSIGFKSTEEDILPMYDFLSRLQIYLGMKYA